MPSEARAVRRERRREVVRVAERRVRREGPREVVCEARETRSEEGQDRPSEMVRSRRERTVEKSLERVEIRSDKSESCEERGGGQLRWKSEGERERTSRVKSSTLTSFTPPSLDIPASAARTVPSEEAFEAAEAGRARAALAVESLGGGGGGPGSTSEEAVDMAG